MAALLASENAVQHLRNALGLSSETELLLAKHAAELEDFTKSARREAEKAEKEIMELES